MAVVNATLLWTCCAEATTRAHVEAVGPVAGGAEAGGVFEVEGTVAARGG